MVHKIFKTMSLCLWLGGGVLDNQQLLLWANWLYLSFFCFFFRYETSECLSVSVCLLLLSFYPFLLFLSRCLCTRILIPAKFLSFLWILLLNMCVSFVCLFFFNMFVCLCFCLISVLFVLPISILFFTLCLLMCPSNSNHFSLSRSHTHRSINCIALSNLINSKWKKNRQRIKEENKAS